MGSELCPPTSRWRRWSAVLSKFVSEPGSPVSVLAAGSRLSSEVNAPDGITFSPCGSSLSPLSSPETSQTTRVGQRDERGSGCVHLCACVFVCIIIYRCTKCIRLLGLSEQNATLTAGIYFPEFRRLGVPERGCSRWGSRGGPGPSDGSPCRARLAFPGVLTQGQSSGVSS